MIGGLAKENRIKREMIKIRKHTNELHEKLAVQNERKVKRMKSEHIRKNMNQERVMKQEMSDLREEWIKARIGEGNPPPIPTKVHVYGDIQMDADELACASLGPKFMEYPVLDKNTHHHPPHTTTTHHHHPV